MEYRFNKSYNKPPNGNVYCQMILCMILLTVIDIMIWNIMRKINDAPKASCTYLTNAILYIRIHIWIINYNHHYIYRRIL